MRYTMYMAQTINLTQSEYQKLLQRIVSLEKKVQSLLNRLQKEPPYGSDEWWEWSNKKAIEDIKAGKYTAFKSAKEMVEHLESL